MPKQYGDFHRVNFGIPKFTGSVNAEEKLGLAQFWRWMSLPATFPFKRVLLLSSA
jgi:hypothetical protein